MNHHAVPRGAWPFEPPRFRLGNTPTLCFLFIILFSFLSIDKLAWLATGFRSAGSITLLIPAGILFLYYWQCVIGNWMVLFAVAPVLTYLVFATAYGISRDDDVVLLRSYFFSCILITTIAGHVVQSDENEVDYILKFSRNTLFISSILVILSPHYYPYLSNVPEHMNFRNSGFFANPNDASLCIVIFFNSLLYVPYRRKIFNYLGVLVAITGVLSAYSKAGIIAFLASCILYMLIRYKWRFVLILVIFMPFLQALFWPLADFLFESYVVTYMHDDRIDRIERMLAFMEGGFSEKYVGYKNILWPHAIFVIQENFPHGAGLGAFHHLFGVVFEKGDWQGVHNMYLMIAGEAGFFAFVFFVSCYGGLLVFAIFSTRSRFATAIMAVSLLYYGTTHAGFGDRFQVAIFAISIGLLSRKENTPDPDSSAASFPSSVPGRRPDFHRPV